MQLMSLRTVIYTLPLMLSPNLQADAEITLPTIHVKANFTDSAFHRHLDRDQIANTAKSNNSIDALLRTHSAVQFASGADNSEQLGEIAPANISFHGEAFYNNQFAIDGLSNTVNFNPAHNGTSPVPDALTINNHTPNQLPAGHTQAFWISNQLVDKVSVMDSNVPARFGKFTGGYVDAKLIEPQTDKPSGSISYRQSRDDWTKFYIDNAYEADFSKGISPETQPKFVKQQFHFDVNVPLNEKAAVLFAYDREESRIPLFHQHLNEQHKQQRLAETFYLKGRYDVNNQNRFLAGLIYSPHKATYYPENIKDGRYEDEGGGWRVDFTWEHSNDFADVDTRIAYRQIHEMQAYDKQNLYRYQGNTPTIDWVSFPDTEEATVGGLGTVKNFSDELMLKQDWFFKPIKGAFFDQEWSAGWSYQYARAGIKRDKASYIYAGAAPTDETDCSDCIPGEQYFTWYTHIHPVHVRVPNSSAAIWAENRLSRDNLHLNLGLRADYNQFLKNIDIAPRLSFKYDFSDKGYYVSGGANRYYGTEMLTYKLQGAFKDQDNYNRRFGEDNNQWIGKAHMFLGFADSQLKTPYSDELNLAIGQETDNYLWQGKWVRRFSRDQFMSKRYEDDEGRIVRELTNEGRGRHDTFSLSFDSLRPWKLGMAEIAVSAGLDYHLHKSSLHGQTFKQTEWWKEHNVQQMLVDGKFYHPKDMPAISSFNRPWGGYLAAQIKIPAWHLTWQPRLRYEAARKFYQQTNLRCPNSKPTLDRLCAGYQGGNLTRYDGVEYSSAILNDWHFSWDKALAEDSTLSLSLDILNVFNRKIVGKRIVTPAWEEKKRDVSYQPGRQFWFGVKYRW